MKGMVMEAANDNGAPANAGAPFALLDLFSGIGGFSAGLETSGYFKTAAMCEIEPFPRRVLSKHWPKVRLYEDVRKLTADTLRCDGISINAICGGFPCQDVSSAGPGSGLAGSRSGLWYEYARIIEETEPEIVVIENSAFLRSRGLEIVLGKFASLGYDVVWHCIPASHVGAPHERDRIWIVAANAKGIGRRQGWAGRFTDCLSRLSNTPRWNPANSNRQPEIGASVSWRELSAWPNEPAILGVGDGIPDRMDRVRALGNAVVPLIPELLGRAIGHAFGLIPPIAANDNNQPQVIRDAA